MWFSRITINLEFHCCERNVNHLRARAVPYHTFSPGMQAVIKWNDKVGFKLCYFEKEKESERRNNVRRVRRYLAGKSNIDNHANRWLL